MDAPLSEKEIEVDVLVVGGGPAGSRAAEESAHHGADVLLVERGRGIGAPVRCAEFLHRKVFEQLDMGPDAMVQEITGMVTHLPDRTAPVVSRGPGIMLDRMTFDKTLARRAKRAGARIMTGARAVAPLREDDRGLSEVLVDIRGSDTPLLVRASAVIGADGPSSRVGSWLGRVNHRRLVAMQRTVVLHEVSTRTEVFLSPEYKGGYGWLFPRRSLANVGVGVDMSMGASPRICLEALIRKIGERIGEVRAVTAGLIPVNGPLCPAEGNVLLAGDAAGLTHPITGGGIHQAVHSGHLAGRRAAEIAEGDREAGQRYSEECPGIFGPVLSHALRKREIMVREWDRAVRKDRFGPLMGRCWTSLEGYGREEE